MGFAHGEAHGAEAEAHSAGSVPSDIVKPEAERVEDHDAGSDWDSDGSGWIIDESRIQFTEAGYELFSNGFNEEDELPSGFTSTLVDTQDTLPVEGAVTDVSTQPQSSVQRQRAWSVRGMRFEVSADRGPSLRGTVPLDADITAAVTATMARVQLEVPASFKAVPEDVLEATLKQPFSTEPGFSKSFTASFEKRSTTAPPDKPALAPEELGEVQLETECGADYTLLRDLLAAGEWQKADDETRLKLCQLAGEDAEAREWVYFSEVKDIPATDLRTMDKLWTTYSRGRYGFSVQRQLWLAEKRRWGPFFARVGWTQGPSKAYRKFPSEFLWQADAPKGHLPLTNCLRGTQLFSEVLQHPAFGGPLEPLGVRAGANGSTSMGGATFARGGPPPLEQLEPTQRLLVTAGGLLLVLLGLANQH